MKPSGAPDYANTHNPLEQRGMQSNCENTTSGKPSTDYSMAAKKKRKKRPPPTGRRPACTMHSEDETLLGRRPNCHLCGQVPSKRTKLSTLLARPEDEIRAAHPHAR